MSHNEGNVPCGLKGSFHILQVFLKTDVFSCNIIVMMVKASIIAFVPFFFIFIFTYYFTQNEKKVFHEHMQPGPLPRQIDQNNWVNKKVCFCLSSNL